jgi:hypothetical protein
MPISCASSLYVMPCDSIRFNSCDAILLRAICSRPRFSNVSMFVYPASATLSIMARHHQVARPKGVQILLISGWIQTKERGTVR